MANEIVHSAGTGRAFALIRLLALIACAGLEPGYAEEQLPIPAPEEKTETFPPIALRGYGTLAGSFQELAGGSLLEIDCDSSERALLLQAKYLSDLCVLPGVERQTAGGLACYNVKDQGSIVAFCKGSRVTIAASKDIQSLEELIAGLKPEGITTPQVEVPMYLNRWDKYGWRFYFRHRPLQSPNGYGSATYDLFKDFDAAAALDHSGMVFWNFGCSVDTAEAMMMESEWDWAAKAADRRGLPFAVNSGNELGQAFPFLANRYPDQLQQKMPQLVGNFHKVGDPYLGARGQASWCSSLLNDTGLGILQDSIRRFASMPSLVSFMEPHMELFHGSWDILFEYGPLADASWQSWLKDTYGTVDALSLRWYGSTGKITSWDSIGVPEIASFLGWNAGAVDLKGEWAVGYEELADPKLKITRDANDRLYYKKIASRPAPPDWFGEHFDDSSWPKLTAPGDDQAMFIQHRPAVFRRDFVMDADRLRGHPHWWLYVWDLNDAFQPPDMMMVYINGRKAGESLNDTSAHWAAFDVATFIRPGTNQISLRLPKGYLGYRIYLSPDEPKQYPRLGSGGDARWADFMEWTTSTRLAQVRRGMEMLRQVDANRPISLAAPDHYADGIKTLAEEYGGEFHNTGYMGVFYADYLPGLMQGAGLPFSVELGEPAKDPAEFKKTMGLYLIENVQSVDYYDHVGKLLWNPEMSRNFTDNLKLYHLFGKYHSPRSELAVLFSTEAQTLSGFPWSNDPNANFPAGYFPWNISSPLRGYYGYDFLSESSFGSGDAAKYRVIIDSNSSIMSSGLTDEIEKWVRSGGVFITSGQTGRHTPAGFDSWPVSKLAGYKITRVDRLSPDGSPLEKHGLSVPAGQDIFSGSWNGVSAGGLGLQKTSSDCQDLMLWDDGSTAIGCRHVGKGLVIQVGVAFDGTRGLKERIELDRNSVAMRQYRELYTCLLKSLHMPEAEATVPADMVFARHYVSNNGLYDVWTVWNENNAAITTNLLFGQKFNPKAALEVSSGAAISPVGINGRTGIKDIQLAPLQSRGFLTPRDQIETAPRDWFALQREWWRGTEKPPEGAFPTVASAQKYAVNLVDDWAFKPLEAGADIGSLASAGADDSSWERMRLGTWAADYPQVKDGLFRKKFRVPDNWTGGVVRLWLQAWSLPTFKDTASVYLDGTLICRDNSSGIPGEVFEALKPGTEHVLAIEIKGGGTLAGFLGGAWLSFLPAPLATQSLEGEWTGSRNALNYDVPVSIPGQWKDLWLAKRSVTIPAQYEGYNVLVHYAGSADLTGVIINGRWIRQDHQQTAKDWVINVTPWVKFGQANELQVGRLAGSGSGDVKTLQLDFYKKGTYP